MPPHRALGPHDKRLQSHRCQNCRRARTKCDGARPCSTCRVRQVQCTEAVVPSHQPTFLHYLPEYTTPHPLLDENAAIEAFFTFVGPEPHSPISVPFSPAVLSPQLGSSGPVRAVVAAIGALASARPSNAAATHLHAFSNTRRSLWGLLYSDVYEPSSHLLFGLLLGIFEFMYEPSGLGFFTVMKTVSARIIGKCARLDNNWLLILYNFLDANRALYTREEPFPCAAAPPPPESSSAEQVVFHRFVSFASIFASLHARVPRWLNHVASVGEKCPQCGQDAIQAIVPRQHHPCDCLKRSGEALVKQAHAVLVELQRLAAAVQENWPVSINPQDWISIAPAWYHACAISLASLFADGAWSALYPADEVLRQLIEAAHTGLPWPARLAAVEKRIAAVEFEAFSLLPLLLSISLEVKDDGARARIATLYDTVIAKGYAAGSFSKDGLTYLQSISSTGSREGFSSSSGSLS